MGPLKLIAYHDAFRAKPPEGTTRVLPTTVGIMLHDGNQYQKKGTYMTELPTNWTKTDDSFIENAIRRGASRRELLQIMLAGGVALSAGTLLLSNADRALADTPVKGGALRVAGWSSSTADTLDPAKASATTDYVRLSIFYNRLVNLDEGGNPVMELAESVETKDAKVWTIALRKGVTFHSGKTLTADDVVFSLKRHLDPTVGSKVAKVAAQMKVIKAVDSNTVQIELENANADLPSILTLHHFAIVADGTTDFSAGNGTGAFTKEVFEPGLRSVGLKNKNYWRSTGPNVDSVEFFAIVDDNARVNALLSGDIQIAGQISPRSKRLIDNNKGFGMVEVSAGNYTNLNIRLDMSPGDKKDFVDGMKYLVNREQIIKAAYRGFAQIGNDQPISQASRFHDAELKPKAFDPEKAKFLINKSGLLGQTIPVIASEAASGSIDIAMIIQASAAQIGLKLDVQRVASDGYWNNYWLKSPVHFGNIDARPTPDVHFSLFYASNASWNESRYKSERFDSMLAEARGLLDDAKRREIYNEMQVMVSDEAGTIIPAYNSSVDAMTEKVKGYGKSPFGALMGGAFAERVWLSA